MTIREIARLFKAIKSDIEDDFRADEMEERPSIPHTHTHTQARKATGLNREKIIMGKNTQFNSETSKTANKKAANSRHLWDRRVIFRPYSDKKAARFILSIVWRGGYGRDGKARIHYELRQITGGGYSRVIFAGGDFFCSPLHCTDSNETIKGLMAFLTLRPGDTDSEYFKDYTPAQLAFCEAHAESLSCAVYSRFGE